MKVIAEGREKKARKEEKGQKKQAMAATLKLQTCAELKARLQTTSTKAAKLQIVKDQLAVWAQRSQVLAQTILKRGYLSEGEPEKKPKTVERLLELDDRKTH